MQNERVATLMQHDQPEMKFLIKYEKLFEMWSIDLV
jgi:hypothetical protein